MVSHKLKLERGLLKEKTNIQHIDLKDFKPIPNFKNTKETLRNIKLELLEVPDIKDLKRLSFNRCEKGLEEIIKPKDEAKKEEIQYLFTIMNSSS